MIFLGIGSNLSSSFGDRFANIDLSIFHLKSSNIKIVKKSSFYETPSYPDASNPKFINDVVSVETNLSAVDLMSLLISIERKIERERKVKNAPRTCDIDILDYNGQIIQAEYDDKEFLIPHKKLSKRNFVLYPLKEISPKWKHPETNELIEDLIDKLSLTQKNSILKI